MPRKPVKKTRVRKKSRNVRCPPGCVKKSMAASRKKSRKASRKKSRKASRKAPPSGIIKKQNLAVGETMPGMDGNMYEVVEIEMRGKKVRKWKKSKKVGM